MQNTSNVIKDSQIKARKRQFDSRWRANIASCFETLLQIIPIYKRVLKKQSKAQILEATINHLNFLEKIFIHLLKEKSRRLEVTSEIVWCSEKFRKMEEQFIEMEESRPRRLIQNAGRIKKFQSSPEAPILSNKQASHAREHALPSDLPSNHHGHTTVHSSDPSVQLHVTSEKLHCGEQVSDEEGNCSLSPHETPIKSANSSDKENIRPSKKKVITITPRPSKAARSLIREEAFVRRDFERDFGAIGASADALKGLFKDDEYGGGGDEKMGAKDPWLVSEAFQNVLLQRPLRNRPPFATHHDILSLMEDTDEASYVGKDSSLFSVELCDEAAYDDTSAASYTPNPLC